jgi:hypothetical protein
MVPRNSPKQYSLVMSGPKLVETIAAPSATNPAHAVHANGMESSPAGRVVTPGCQIGYMDYTCCHQTMFGLQNNVVKSANPTRCDGEERFVHFVDIDVVDLIDADDVAVAAQQRDQAQGVERYKSCIRESKL